MTVAIAPAMYDERPASFAIDNSDGTGAIVLVCDHASHAIPARYAGLGLSETDRLRHIGWDIGALGLSRALAARLDAPLIHATLSQLLLDLNRHPDAHDAIVTASEDIVVPGNRDLTAIEREDRRRWIYEPYHDAIETLIAARLAQGRQTAVIAVHSFTPTYRGIVRPWRVGVLSQHDRRMADALLAALRADPALADPDAVGDNRPYAPADGVYHTLERHAEAQGLPCAMLEVRNDLIQNGTGQEAWADRLAPLLQRALEASTATPGAAASGSAFSEAAFSESARSESARSESACSEAAPPPQP